jgi:hypothetical protein
MRVLRKPARGEAGGQDRGADFGWPSGFRLV